MTCTVKSVCDEMAEESDRDILLCYYNKLVENINSSGYTNLTEDDEACSRTLLAKLSADIQNGLDQGSSEMRQDMTDLVTTVADSSVVYNMERAKAIFWLILACIVLVVVIYLWNFK